MITQKDEGIYVDDTILVNDFDAIIFDCDGVLIDVTNSYDKVIIKTADFVLKHLRVVLLLSHQRINEFAPFCFFRDAPKELRLGDLENHKISCMIYIV